MLRATHILLALLTLLLLLGSTASAKDPAPNLSGKMTVGEFALKVIRLAEDDPAKSASLTEEQALERLRLAGLSLQGSPDDPLTEADKSLFFLAVAQGLMQKVAPPPPTGFDACMGLPTVPECHACCLALEGSSRGACGRACGQDHADQQKPSPCEPHK
jgi:hypothetical protein